MPSLARSRHLVLATSLSLAVAALIAGPASGVGAATPPCKVTNTRTAVTFGAFQKAVSKATAGDTLQLRGTCAGPIAIGKNLTVIGVKTTATGAPTLTGKDATPVLWIKSTATVTLRTLVIRDGLAEDSANYPANSGAGILLEGTATLVGVTVRDNVAPNSDAGAGGIEVEDVDPAPTLTISGASKLFGNQGGFGGAIENYGTLTIGGTTRIHHNLAQQNGGAIYNDATLILKGSARIDHNTAASPGGAIFTDVSVAVSGTVVIDANTGSHGGGIYLGGGTLSLVPGTDVRDNHATTANSGGGVGWTGGTPEASFTGLQCGVNVHDNTAGPGNDPNDCPVSG